MKIAFDSWALSSRFRRHGTYVYARALAQEFLGLTAENPEIEFCLFTPPDNSRHSNDARLIATGERFTLERTPLLNRQRLWRLGSVNRAAARVGADLVFSPTCIVPRGAVPVVCTIHDVTPIVMPSNSRSVTWLQRTLLRSAARRSRAIIAVSQNSKMDILNIYGLEESRVSVVYNGFDKTLFTQTAPDAELLAQLRSRLGISRPYVLHHGVIQPRKNLKRLIEAYRCMLARNRNLDVDLVLAGPLGWAYEEVVAAAQDVAGSLGRVIVAGALADTDLALLIKGASLAVVPSLYEGFCLTMVEAMACGTPTVAANASCLPEVSGGVLKYFDPYSVEEMAHCMESTLENTGLLRELAQRGKKYALRYCWRRCAQETLEILKSQVTGRRSE